MIATGAFDLREFKLHFTRVLDTCLAYQLSSVLWDLRAQTFGNPLQTIEKLEFAAFMAQEWLNYLRQGLTSFRIALVGPQTEINQFIETAGRNRSLNIKTTDDLKEALAWLGMP